MVVATAVSGVFTIFLLGLYIYRNRTRRNEMSEEDEKRVYEDLDRDERTDFEIPNFRYVY